MNPRIYEKLISNIWNEIEKVDAELKKLGEASYAFIRLYKLLSDKEFFMNPTELQSESRVIFADDLEAIFTGEKTREDKTKFDYIQNGQMDDEDEQKLKFIIDTAIDGFIISSFGKELKINHDSEAVRASVKRLENTYPNLCKYKTNDKSKIIKQLFEDNAHISFLEIDKIHEFINDRALSLLPINKSIRKFIGFTIHFLQCEKKITEYAVELIVEIINMRNEKPLLISQTQEFLPNHAIILFHLIEDMKLYYEFVISVIKALSNKEMDLSNVHAVYNKKLEDSYSQWPCLYILIDSLRQQFVEILN